MQRLLLLLALSPSVLPATHYATSIRSRSPKLEDPIPQEDPNLPQKRLTLSINKFSNRLYNVMNEYRDADYEPDNPRSFEDLVYSPISVFTSLSTLRSGCVAETRSELSTVLSLSKINDSVVEEGISSILSTYDKEHEASVTVLNRVFIDHSFSPLEDYVNTVRDKFHGDTVHTSFSNATGTSYFVNNHVSMATGGVLQDVIRVDGSGEGVTEGSVTGGQVIDGGLMLVSGLTFEAPFLRPFTPMLTRRERFVSEDGSVTEVAMMHRDGVYGFAEIPELNASVLSISYKDQRLTLNVLLPEEGSSIAELEENLESFPFVAVMSRLKSQYVQVSLPRFQVDGTVDLMEPLEKLGVHRVFSEGAQFSRLVDGGVFLTNAVHKVVFDVGEGGSSSRSFNFIEAVPAQARVLTPFKVSRPFVFFVADSLLNSVLVVGRKVT